ncbi:hypothetical protein [Arthrobacter sunyaminii]|uniref:Uncharacterized protein n=1 Tax=Arthrobacter sunyaminii TaxID=2816859 RepID=A0A975S858_9MICC|nr:hypothetical protein [Arthrobacter sunyaminii]MBO0906797.1 hypothetical protein [Arthrobacter sunyaminii]QWQ37564.1 hypothetical protein KG104_07520 [Arthrobacter sunyaminii]
MSEHLNKENPRAADKNDSPAIWFFVAAVFVITLPQMGNGGWLALDSWISMAAGVLLTSLGFWSMARGRRG